MIPLLGIGGGSGGGLGFTGSSSATSGGHSSFGSLNVGSGSQGGLPAQTVFLGIAAIVVVVLLVRK